MTASGRRSPGWPQRCASAGCRACWRRRTRRGRWWRACGGQRLLLPVGAAAQLSARRAADGARARAGAMFRRGDIVGGRSRRTWRAGSISSTRWRRWPVEGVDDRPVKRPAMPRRSAPRARRPRGTGRLLKLAARNNGHVLPALGATAGFEALRRRLMMLRRAPYPAGRAAGSQLCLRRRRPRRASRGG